MQINLAGAQAYKNSGISANQLMDEHGELVRRIAWHVHSRTGSRVELEDLIQVGLIALVEAARSYEDQGFAFTTYASTRIRGAMIDLLRREASISRGGMAARKELNAAREQLVKQFMREPSEPELAAAMGLDMQGYYAKLASATAVEHQSMDESYSEHDLWFADQAPAADEIIEQEQFSAALAASIASLPEREAQILQLFFVEEMNLEEIGEVFGVGAARICQIKKAALSKLRQKLG